MNNAMKPKKESKQYFSFKTFGKSEKGVIFLFTGFRMKRWLYYLTIRKLMKAGYYVIVYDIDSSLIFHGEISDFLYTVEALINTVKQQVNDLKQQGAKVFFSYGTSMGTIFAMRIAIEIQDIKKIIVNLTYGSLADNVWTWSVLKGVKKRLEHAGITKEKLETLLEPISPLSMAPKLKGKKLLLYLAKKDKIILFNQSLQFKEALDKAGIEYIYYQNNRFGHFIAGSLNNLRSKIYLDFLQKNEWL